MIFVLRFADWTPEFVERECAKRGLGYAGKFAFVAACTRLASHALKQSIRQEFGVTGALLTTKTGKPFFENSTVRFNLTHHGGYCVAIVSENASQGEVGIDLTDRVSIFTESEEEELYTEPPEETQRGVFWAVREAYLKYTGAGCSEAPLRILPPAHRFYPDLLRMNRFAVMPVIRVADVYARVFSVGPLVGAVVAPLESVQDVRVVSL